MNKKLFIRIIVMMYVMTGAVVYAGEGNFDAKLAAAHDVLQTMFSDADDGIPSSLVKSCKAIVIFPGVVKGGFIIGGRYGEGIVMAKNEKGKWGAPAYFTVTGGSWGLQIGGQEMDMVLLVMNKEGFDILLDQKFTLGGDASVAAGPTGKTADAESNVTLKANFISYTRSRGLFAGVSVKGARIDFYDEMNRKYYGEEYTPRQILLKGMVETPSGGKKLAKILDNYSGGKSVKEKSIDQTKKKIEKDEETPSTKPAEKKIERDGKNSTTKPGKNEKKIERNTE